MQFFQNLSKYYDLKPLEETKQDLDTLRNTKQDESVSQHYDADYKDIPSSKDLDELALKAQVATTNLAVNKYLTKGSQLAFHLHEQQKKILTEFTPQHAACIATLAKISENLTKLAADRELLNAVILEHEEAYKKALKLHDISS